MLHLLASTDRNVTTNQNVKKKKEAKFLPNMSITRIIASINELLRLQHILHYYS